MAEQLDRRLHAFRPDLADARLRGRVDATRFVTGTDYVVTRCSAPMHGAPSLRAPLETEALYGEIVCVFEEADGWAWGQLATDGYVGYLPGDALRLSRPEGAFGLQRVSAAATHVFSDPDIKSRPRRLLPLNARVDVAQVVNGFAELVGAGYVVARHLSGLDDFADDYVAVAMNFIGTPYLWGGRTRGGIDCSGLVQASLLAAGLPCPRDSDMQRDAVGEVVDVAGGLSQVRRGDLIFWAGHVGLVSDSETLLHANAFHMSTVMEPLAGALERIANSSGKPVAVRRPRRAG